MDGFIWLHYENDEWEIGWVVVGVGDAAGGPHHERGRGMGALQRDLVQVSLDLGNDIPYAVRKELSLGRRPGAQASSSGPSESA